MPKLMRHTILLFLLLITVHPLAARPQPGGRGEPKALSIEEKFVLTELYFGRNKPGGGTVSDAEWQAFADEIVTPRFPEGLTILGAMGQWRGKDGSIAREESKVVVLLYSRKVRRAVNSKIEEIRSEYKKRFQQESVMRIDITKSVSVSF
jgi:hypothetical protein